jgi:hypothetical protein
MLKVYDLFYPNESRKFTTMPFDVFAYSSINFAVMSWLILILKDDIKNSNFTFLVLLGVFAVLFASPVALVLLYRWLINIEFIKSRIIHPIPKPWDYMFGKKLSYWLIIHLKNGEKVGGIYSTNSFTSSFPHEEQIYIEQVWLLNRKNEFLKPVPGTEGMLILNSEILAIEFFISEGKSNVR